MARPIRRLINAGDPFRKIGFIFALGTILGAAIVDMTMLARDAIKRVREVRAAGPSTETVDRAEGERQAARARGSRSGRVALLIVASQVLHVLAGCGSRSRS